MNKTIKKFFPCLIALILLLTTLLGACTSNDTSSSDGNKNQNEIENVDFTEGHNYTATKTNKPFIVNVAVIGYCVICVHHTLSDSVVFINKAELDNIGEYSLILFPLLSIL